MSKRFVLNATKENIQAFFAVGHTMDFNIEPNFNVSTGDLCPIIITEENTRKLVQAKWGLIPPGVEDERAGKENYNYQIEDAPKNKRLRSVLKNQRALIPASGFYKWKRTENKATPFYVRLLSSDVIALAGIYDLWKSPSGRELYSFALLTDQANALLDPISERRPLVIKPEDFDDWLNKDIAADVVLQKIEAYPSTLTEMIVNRVDDAVNDINNNDPSLIQPIPK